MEENRERRAQKDRLKAQEEEENRALQQRYKEMLDEQKPCYGSRNALNLKGVAA